MKYMMIVALCWLVALTAGCAQSASNSKLVRICDSSGCSDRPADSQTYKPSTALPDEDPDGRIAALELLAKDDPRAAYDLGLRLFRGDGIRRDSYRALQWMRYAAERGDLQAQKAVGRLYLTGLEEMGSDPKEAEKWLTIAASRGDKEAEQLLAEATEARKSDDVYYKWANRWRARFNGYWYHAYPYRAYWRHGHWHYY